MNWNKKIYYSGYFNSLEVDGTNINLVFSSVLLFFFPPVIREESHCQMLKRENIISKMTRNTKRDILIQEPTLLCLFYFFLPSNQGTNHVTSITCYIYYFICWMVMFMSTFLVHYTIYNLKWLNTWASCQGPRSLKPVMLNPMCYTFSEWNTLLLQYHPHMKLGHFEAQN